MSAATALVVAGWAMIAAALVIGVGVAVSGRPASPHRHREE